MGAIYCLKYVKKLFMYKGTLQYDHKCGEDEGHTDSHKCMFCGLEW